MGKFFEGLLVILCMIIFVSILMASGGLVFWAIGSFTVWAFGINFIFTFWHGLSIFIIIGVLTSTLKTIFGKE